LKIPLEEDEERLNEKDLSTQYDQQKKDPWIFAADEYQRGTEGIEAQKGQREEATDGMMQASAKKDERLRKEERLRRKGDFETIAKEGVRRHTKNFLVIARRNDQGFSRLGAVASKRLGKAVERNRVKRLMREFFRRNKDRLPPSTDYVIVGKKGAQDLQYAQVAAELSAPLKLRKEDGQRSGSVSL
jgi:ribonuclease P protein component